VKNIGILLPLNKHTGHFQLALSIADSLLKHSDKFNYTVLYYDKEMLGWLNCLNDRCKTIQIRHRTALHRFNTFANLVLHSRLLPMTGSGRMSDLHSSGIDLLIMPFQGLFGFMNGIPYIVAVTSNLHRHQSADHEGYPFYRRYIADIITRNSAEHSVVSVADSRQGMIELEKFYSIAEDKIRIIPHMPPGYIYDNRDMDTETADNILSGYALPDRYVFYPSQLSYYKNHVRLVQSLRLVEQRYGVRIPAVFAGQPAESHEEIKALLHKLDMTDQVVHLGFVSEKELVALYKKAVALVYPCLLGPTNIPPLEAMILGTPVACSNLFSMPEQVGDAALLFDPYSLEDMAEKIYLLWTDRNLRERLVNKGYDRVKDMTQKNYAGQWESVIEDALKIIEGTRFGPGGSING